MAKPSKRGNCKRTDSGEFIYLLAFSCRSDLPELFRFLRGKACLVWSARPGLYTRLRKRALGAAILATGVDRARTAPAQVVAFREESECGRSRVHRGSRSRGANASVALRRRSARGVRAGGRDGRAQRSVLLSSQRECSLKMLTMDSLG